MALSSMPEGFEPMQVDASNSEENDNDVDDGRLIIGMAAGNGVGPHGSIGIHQVSFTSFNFTSTLDNLSNLQVIFNTSF
jgi:hypothetical protein